MIKEFDLKLEKKRDFYQVTNKTKNEIVLFSNDKEKVSSIRFDSTFNIKDSISAVRPESTYEEILGYTQKDESYSIFWGSKDRKKIFAQSFDFATKQINIKFFDLELKKEKIVKELTINNVFYIITLVKNIGNLKFYVFDPSGELDTKTVDLSKFEFNNKEGNPVNLHTALTWESSNFFFQNINNESPPSLALSTRKNKIYTYKNDEIIFTLDTGPHATDILRINLNDFTASLKAIKQQRTISHEYDGFLFESNSFLIDDKLIQIKTNPEVLYLTISDLDGMRINTYKALRDEEIPFKNTDVFQESGTFSNKKILEKPKQFIRKINNSTPGISCYKLDGLYYTVIGSSEDIANGGGMGMGMAGGFSSAPIAMSYSSYTIENLISYRDKNVVYTTCLFDSNFNHLKDEVKTSAFEKIRIFLEENENIKDGRTLFNKVLYKDLILFKLDSSIYLGNYNKQNKKYQIFSFSE
ncbi:hypothetical protein ACWA1F_04050 [Flavobacterium sp. 3-218]